MKRKTAAWAGVGLFGVLMVAIAGVLYTQMNQLLFPGLALIGGMFVVCMGLLWVSEYEDAPEKDNAGVVKRRQEGSR
ncbi:hypothetical protein SAMN02799630_01454 [Paenibacillus sp. UNCCL117]|uniref:hypothetical protein n=1 Tax=unclassified Paenibacillus TaxID=185978 RepID=UPI00088049C9|nr:MULTISPECIES: hypothetical protein [unclassified Paenibacillus]SDC77634.1 hypothetical protein SAMN04488602_103433 [Paenibacillus sp. cl123]SFW25869.1 hypothetical protein SAMN02799630_01454 [Paenibacillus sp. UNCCL117]